MLKLFQRDYKEYTHTHKGWNEFANGYKTGKYIYKAIECNLGVIFSIGQKSISMKKSNLHLCLFTLLLIFKILKNFADSDEWKWTFSFRK